MKAEDVAKLEHGLYLIHWDNGGVSAAAVGSLHSGLRWLACANWTSEEGGVSSARHWDQVKSVELIIPAPYGGLSEVDIEYISAIASRLRAALSTE